MFKIITKKQARIEKALECANYLKAHGYIGENEYKMICEIAKIKYKKVTKGKELNTDYWERML